MHRDERALSSPTRASRRARRSSLTASIASTLALALAALLALSGCLPKLEPAPYDAGPRPDAFFIPMEGVIPPFSGNFSHVVREDGTVETLVDATSITEWQYLELETGEAVTPEDPQTDHRWGLAFWRYVVNSNGGVSGTGGGSIARLEGTSFEAVTRAPETGWVADWPDGPDDLDDMPDSLMANGVDDWFHYDLATHILTPREGVVYVVETPSENFFKIRLYAYYDSVGTPAYVRFLWAPVDPPEGRRPMLDAGVDASALDAGAPDAGSPDGGVFIPRDALRIDASDPGRPVYVDVEALSPISVGSPSTSTTWDLVFSGETIRTNAGADGPGTTAARVRTDVTYDALSSTGTLGFVTEGEPGVTSPLRDWSYRDGSGQLRPRDVVFVVVGGGGAYVRLRIWHYDAGVYWVSMDWLDVAPETVELTLDASDPSAFRYVDLHRGEAVEVPSPESSRAWDLALSLTRIRTNSGTSGAGVGGALDTSEPSFAALTSVPTIGYEADALLEDPLEVGGHYDGSAVLSAFYDGDPTASPITLRATTFAVRLADGGLGKLAVTSYEAGRYRLAWSYAGAGRSTF